MPMVVDRRLEILKLEGMGLSQPEIVKQIRSTLKYIDLEANIFQNTDDQFFAKVANNVKEACALIEVGFEYVTGDYNEGGKIFRKRR